RVGASLNDLGHGLLRLVLSASGLLSDAALIGHGVLRDFVAGEVGGRHGGRVDSHIVGGGLGGLTVGVNGHQHTHLSGTVLGGLGQVGVDVGAGALLQTADQNLLAENSAALLGHVVADLLALDLCFKKGFGAVESGVDGDDQNILGQADELVRIRHEVG